MIVKCNVKNKRYDNDSINISKVWTVKAQMRPFNESQNEPKKVLESLNSGSILILINTKSWKEYIALSSILVSVVVSISVETQVWGCRNLHAY